MPVAAESARVTKNRRRSADINPTWLSRFGLVITSRDPRTCAVSSVSCRFCLTFGREKGRRSTTHVFSSPYRTDNFRQHLRLSHHEKWTEFEQKASGEERQAFFDVEVPYNETIESHFSSGDPGLFVKIKSSIIDLMLKHYVEDETQRTLPPFVKQVDEDYHLVSIRAERVFKVVIEQISHGLSFREVVLTLRNLRTNCGLGFLNSVTEQNVSHYVKSLAILNLHGLAAILSSDDVWCYSLAIDGATHRGVSYIDIRVRCVYRGCLKNYHLLALPFTASHTGDNMCAVVRDIMRVVGGDLWDHKLLAVTTDGAANMTGRHRGLVTQLQSLSVNTIYRVWCGAHQLDLIVQDCVARQLYDSFYHTFTSLISYLRRQQRFITEHGKCPRVATTRWLSIGNVVSWILRRRSSIIAYIGREDTSNFNGATAEWWLQCYAIEGLMEPVNICFTAIQGKDTLISEQNVCFAKLVEDIKSVFNLQSTSASTGGVDVLSAAALGSLFHCDRGIFATQSGLQEFFEGCSSYVRNCLSAIPTNELSTLYNLCGRVVVEFVANLEALRVERSCDNAPVDRLPPPALPSELKDTTMSVFLAILDSQRDRLTASWSDQDVDNIEEDFRLFQRAVRLGAIPLECLTCKTGPGLLQKAWSRIASRYKYLSRFCMGLGTVFPGTATVEADFSTINQEATAERALSHLSLQGLMFARGWKEFRLLGLWDE